MTKEFSAKWWKKTSAECVEETESGVEKKNGEISKDSILNSTHNKCLSGERNWERLLMGKRWLAKVSFNRRNNSMFAYSMKATLWNKRDQRK